MINTIMTASGIPFRQGRYPDPPAKTYAVYFDHQEIDSADPITPATSWEFPLIVHHDAEVELYEPKPDPDAESALEAELTARGVPWTRQDRYWLQNVQRYQVIYEFSYTEKRRA